MRRGDDGGAPAGGLDALDAPEGALELLQQQSKHVQPSQGTPRQMQLDQHGQEALVGHGEAGLGGAECSKAVNRLVS